MATSAPGPQLSSMATALDDLASRLTGLAEATAGTDDDWMAKELFEVERSLGEARRRLAKVTATLDRRR
jgi:hypothetical protein